jgi:hypothetical protein
VTVEPELKPVESNVSPDEEETVLQDDHDATVHIDQDSSLISISACNYDHSLINYLQSHPLTMK